MTEITRVPLQPIAKGSLAKLWIGLAILVAIAAAIAFAAMPKGVSVDTITAGQGETPGETDVVFVNYTGKLADGTIFDNGQAPEWPVEGIFPNATPLALEQMIPGFREGLLKMQKGGKYTLTIPAELGYGDTPPAGSPIPPGADLIFDVELVDFMPVEQAEQRMQMLQQVMQQQMGGAAPGGPGAPPAPDAQGAQGAGAPPQ